MADAAVAVAPRVDSAERFEVLAGDLIRRVKVACRRERGELDDEALQAAMRLETLIEARGVELVAPLSAKASFLIERQGTMLSEERARNERVQQRNADLARELADLHAERSKLVDELHKCRVYAAGEAERRQYTRLMLAALRDEHVTRFLRAQDPHAAP